MFKATFLWVVNAANEYPKVTAWSAIFGWISFDLLRAAQIFAAMTAGLASFCALILTAPKAYAEVRKWLRKPKEMD